MLPIPGEILKPFDVVMERKSIPLDARLRHSRHDGKRGCEAGVVE